MITINRPVIRETAGVCFSKGKRRNVVIELHPHGGGKPGPAFIGLRLKGTRKLYFLDIAWCFKEAARAFVNARRAERRGRGAAKAKAS